MTLIDILGRFNKATADRNRADASAAIAEFINEVERATGLPTPTNTEPIPCADPAREIAACRSLIDAGKITDARDRILGILAGASSSSRSESPAPAPEKPQRRRGFRKKSTKD